jgi:putative ABC transport system permease protein
MLKHYLVLATKVLLRRRFFTFISLFGISFTLLVLVIATAILDHAFAPAVPESRQDRMLAVQYALMYGPHNLTGNGGGFKLFDQYARDLPGVERLALFTRPFEAARQSRARWSAAEHTDAEFWQILDFTFLEGTPYLRDDVDQARFVAVINATTRRRFSGRRPPPAGPSGLDQRFPRRRRRKDIQMRGIPFADIWVPLTTVRSNAYKSQLMGASTPSRWPGTALACRASGGSSTPD